MNALALIGIRRAEWYWGTPRLVKGIYTAAGSVLHLHHQPCALFELLPLNQSDVLYTARSMLFGFI